MSNDQSSATSRPDADSNTTGTMTIGELSAITGLSPSAIRFYERRGLLPARDASGGWQRYGHDALERLAVIQLSKSAGFSLDETIRILDALDADPDSIPGSPAIWQGLAEVKLVEIDAHIVRLQNMRRLLEDALTYSYLSPDRLRQVPAMLGWTDARPEDEASLPQAVKIPHSAGDLDAYAAPTGSEHDELKLRN